MNRHLLPVLILSILMLAGCSGSLIESKKIEYKSAGKLPPLEIPPDLTAPSRDERYAVPDLASKSTATFSVYKGERTGPAAASTAGDVLPKVSNMHIERAGSQRWLVVSGISADKLWPAIKEFWQELGFIVSIDSPQTGIMETDWAENRAKIPQDFIRSTIGRVLDNLYSTAERDKFRTRLEKGNEPGTVEIYISHRAMEEIYTSEGQDQTVWQPQPANPELEAEMLRRLMIRLGADESQAKTLLATDTKVDRAKLEQAKDGSTLLQLAEPFDRAWRRVGLALDRVNFTVEDRDRAQGVYFVRYVDPDSDNATKASKGFLGRLAFWRRDKSDVKESAQYRILVKGTDDASTVQVLTREGGVEKTDVGKKILNLLFQQLK